MEILDLVKNKDFPTFLQTLEILIHTEDVEILDPRFGRIPFDELQYVPKHKDGEAYLKAYNVINNCVLKRLSLVRKHADLLLSFLKTYNALSEKIDHYKGLMSDGKKQEDAFDILESLTILNEEADENAEYAAYMRYLLRKYPKIKDAVNIIYAHKDELGLPTGFKWSFDY